jgi:hypothetical protein
MPSYDDEFWLFLIHPHLVAFCGPSVAYQWFITQCKNHPLLIVSTRFLLTNFMADLLIRQDQHHHIPDPVAALDTGLYARDGLWEDVGKPDECACLGCSGPEPPRRTGPAPTGATDLSGRWAPPSLADPHPVPLLHPPIRWLLTRPIRETLMKKPLTWSNFIGCSLPFFCKATKRTGTLLGRLGLHLPCSPKAHPLEHKLRCL